MSSVNMLEAKTHLSRLVEAIEQGTQREIIIARNGRKVARLVPLEQTESSRRIGVAKGKFVLPDDIDADNDVITKLFAGDEV
ncbi:MAG: type II toxin-antitoxin system prevent-host-death family antitoxin [Lysobacteraceae bacterium]|uniref:type II toxin-antitoxin system Phd/YefM family antitoxin n=1 Tax=Denitratimonas sp. CY0512 TaxID=3131940 RepID=UPI00309DB49B